MTRRARIALSYGAIVLWMFLPVIPVVIAGAIASFFGAQLDEGNVHPCIVLGRDIGGILYAMGMMGWLGLVTFPSGFLALVLLTVGVVVDAIRATRAGPPVGFCRSCGYDLRATPNRCPECGAVPAAVAKQTHNHG